MGNHGQLVDENDDLAQASIGSTVNFKLVGFKNFVHVNPKSDRFAVRGFHHVEFWCCDATNTSRRFSWGLGMPIVAKSDLSTGNMNHTSYLLCSSQLQFLFTAHYSPSTAVGIPNAATTSSIPTFFHPFHRAFTSSHGLAVRSVAIKVDDAELAFSASV